MAGNTTEKIEQNKSEITKTHKSNRKLKDILIPSAIISIAFSFLITLYGPLEIYFTNKEDFWFDFYTIIGIDLCMFFALSVLVFSVFLIAGLINTILFRVVFLLGAVCYISLYIEGTFMSRFLPMLDGRQMDWADYSSHRLISIAVILIVSAIVIVLSLTIKYKKTETILKYLLSGVSLVLLATVITLALQNNGLVRKKAMVVNKNHEFEMSSDKNMIIFVIDAIDADVFDTVLEAHPDYYDTFSDFTYYNDMLSCYTQTNYAIPNVLTGEWIDNDADLGEYLSTVYNNSPLLDRLERDGYRIGMYENEFIFASNSERVLSFDNVVRGNIRKPDVFSFVKNQIKLVGYRYAPFDLKRLCIVTSKDFKSASDSDASENVFFESNLDFYNDISNAQIEIKSEPFFKLYHIEGGHVPFVYDEDMSIIESGSYELQVAASMTIAKTMINQLKESGTYDNSIIIIMADHGFSLEDIPEDRLHPVFFVKGINEHSDRMRVSEAPVSHEDLQLAFSRLLDGNDSGSIFDWQEGEQRDRKCFVYEYPQLLKNVEFVQHGKAGDMTTLEKVE